MVVVVDRAIGAVGIVVVLRVSSRLVCGVAMAGGEEGTGLVFACTVKLPSSGGVYLGAGLKSGVSGFQ